MQALLGADVRAGDQPVVGGDRAGEDLEQRHLADELVGDRLEHVRQRLTAVASAGDLRLPRCPR